MIRGREEQHQTLSKVCWIYLFTLSGRKKGLGLLFHNMEWAQNVQMLSQLAPISVFRSFSCHEHAAQTSSAESCLHNMHFLNCMKAIYMIQIFFYVDFSHSSPKRPTHIFVSG